MLSYPEPLKTEKISYHTGDVCIGLELTISLSLYSRGGRTERGAIALAFIKHTGASTGDPARIRKLFNFDSPAYLEARKLKAIAYMWIICYHGRIRTCVLCSKDGKNLSS